MRIALDTNVIVCLLNGEPGAAEVSDLLFDVQGQGVLVIGGLVYGELLVRYPESDIVRFLNETGIECDLSFSSEVWNRAASAWADYLRGRRGRGSKSGPVCPYCSSSTNTPVYCSSCGESLAGPRLILPDFVIGAHASVQADGLVTRERTTGFYGRYFPELRLIHG